jgi:hypothetical protein
MNIRPVETRFVIPYVSHPEFIGIEGTWTFCTGLPEEESAMRSDDANNLPPNWLRNRLASRRFAKQNTYLAFYERH